MKDPHEKTPARGRMAVDMLKSLGTRLSSEERAPYDVPDHDDTVDFNEPTLDPITIDPIAQKRQP
ncbi:MAG TPA: hypothetical protein VGO62_00245 [Myxococcota bacterium]